ncbi:MarR family winged helix-turn-helix transcriptional regulator [Metaclostridioides mangenotii]|uniref:DNA-binding MarR family transcriptional regulator n=1 Tax=Metaclostridioides mangenotii TaxID=1540 RepID=A0ABS4ECW7_9FIRM|nr:MarR family transcriptional regulator [Clostridioides mangenotii]MBP1855785.1 DNA-binding MarR family transcriptional regulator [Clostridioides mangenotii]
MNFQLILGGDTITELKNKILREVGALSRTINTLNDNKYKKFNIQKGQYIFLTRICENPGINLIQLTSILKVDKTTTTKATQKLIKEDYITKKINTDDKRISMLYPTEKALEIYNVIITEENRGIDICFKDFSENEKILAYQLVKKMQENIESDWYDLKHYKE